MNTPNRIYTKPRKAKTKPAAFVSTAKRKPTIWDRGVGGGSSGKGQSCGWRAGAHACSSWAGILCLILLGACDHIPDFKAYAPYDPPATRQPRVQPAATSTPSSRARRSIAPMPWKSPSQSAAAKSRAAGQRGSRPI